MFERIVIPLDGSESNERALSHGLALARAFASQVTLMWNIHCAVRPAVGDKAGRFIDPVEWRMLRYEAEAHLERWRFRFLEKGINVEALVVEGPPELRIIEFARDHDVDLVLLPSPDGECPAAWSIPRIAQRLMQVLPSSIMVVRNQTPDSTTNFAPIRYKKMMVPTDGSLRAESVLPFAKTLAERFEAQVLLAHIVRVPEMPGRHPLNDQEAELARWVIERNRHAASKLLARLERRFSGNVKTRLMVSDEIPSGLHQLVADEAIDLVVLSAHGQSGNSNWPFGSVTSSFVSYGTTPFLIVQDVARAMPRKAVFSARDPAVDCRVAPLQG